MTDNLEPIEAPIAPETSVAPPVAQAESRPFPILPFAIAIVAVLAGAALFMSGYSMGRQSSVEPGTPVGAEEAFRPFWDTYHTIDERWAGGEIDRETLVQGAIRGMIESLDDPYSAFMTPQEYRDSLQGIGGEFEGIGADIAAQGPDGTQGCATLGPACTLVVIAPLAGSPAEKAGVLPGDHVVAVDGSSLDGLTVDQARDRIRGPRDTVVVLSVVRGAVPIDIEVTRDVIRQVEVESRELADGTVGYVRLNGFSDRAATEFRDALAAHVDAGRTQLIVDLRGNPGGYVTAARDVASQFIADGVVFWEQTADGTQTPTEAVAGGVATSPDIGVALLIDAGSASASEIVAGALQDHARATLVGQTSFGKGTVQQWQELTGEGGAFRITIARWLTPDKRWINDVGIDPDIEVALDGAPTPGEDPVLDRALELFTDE